MADDYSVVLKRLLDVSDRLDRIEGKLQDVPLYQLPPIDGDVRVEPVGNVQLIQAEQTSGATKVAIRWTEPENLEVDRYEVWVSRTAYSSESPYLVASVQHSPAAFTVTADQDTAAIAYIRTVYKNGLGTDLNASPTVTFAVDVPTSEVADGSITDAKLDRTGDGKIVITATDIQNITASQITGLIQATQINSINAEKITSLIVNGQIDSIAFSKVTSVSITNAMIESLEVSKISGWSGAVIDITSAIRFGVTGSTYVGSNQIDVTDLYVSNLYPTYIQVGGGPNFTVTQAGVVNGVSFTATGVGDFNSLKINGTTRIATNGAATLYSIDIGGVTVISASGAGLFQTLNVSSGVYKVAGTQVVGSQQSAIANPTVSPPSGSGTAVASSFDGDAYNCVNELYSKLNSVLAALRAHGLIAT